MKEYIIPDEFIDDITKKFASAQGQLKELIRCKDCIFYNGHEKYCDCDMYARENGYCYVAKRKEE